MNPTLVLPALMWLASGCVPTTGPPTSGPPDDDTDGKVVDETGYLDGTLLHYSADQTLAYGTTAITVVGLPGLLLDGGTLWVRNATTAAPSAPSRGDDGAFVAVVLADLGDDIEVVQWLEGTTLTATLPIGADPATGPYPNQNLPQTGPLWSEPDAGGLSTLDPQQAGGLAAPLVAYNERTGDSVFAADLLGTVQISAESTDEVCLFMLDPSDDSGPLLCAQVP